MTKCAACGFSWKLEGRICDGNFDAECPKCGMGVVEGGDGEEIRKRLKKRESLNQEIQRLASRSIEPDYVGPRYSLEEILDELEILHAKIKEEIQRREND